MGSWGSLVGREGADDCAGDNTRLPMMPRCLPGLSIQRWWQEQQQQRLGDRWRPSEEAEGEAEENRDTPSLPALLIGHIRLSSMCRGAGCGSCIIPSVQGWNVETRSPPHHPKRWGGGRVTEMKEAGGQKTCQAGQVCTVPLLLGHDLHTQCPLK